MAHAPSPVTPGYLWVVRRRPSRWRSAQLTVCLQLSEPGKLVGLDEYHSAACSLVLSTCLQSTDTGLALRSATGWYDNIHVAMRMTAIPEFLTGSRWECTDGKAPRFTANYDIASVALFSHDKYTGLRANRPPLEADIVKRLETLDRRTCATVQQSSPPPPSFEQTPGYMATVAGKKASFDGEQIDALKGVKGWKRSHRHEVYDSLNTGNGHEPWANIAPEMVTIHGASSARPVCQRRQDAERRLSLSR